MVFRQRNIALFSGLLLLLLALGACSETSASFNKVHRGRALDVTVVNLERVSQLRYRVSGPGDDVRHYRLAPSSEELELVLLRLKVANHTATSASFNVDEQAAELRDFVRGKYFPINVDDRVEEVDAPSNPNEERPTVFIKGPFELQRGFGIDGLMVFETPKDTRFSELRWRAGDSLTIRF